MATSRRPSFPWASVIIGGLAIFGAIALVRWVVGTVLFLAQVALLVVLVVIVLGAVTRRGR